MNPLQQAFTLLRNGEHAEAAAAFALAEKAGADKVLCKRRRAECLHRAGSHEETLAECQALEAVSRNDPVAPLFRGYALRALKREAEALESFRVAAMRGEPVSRRILSAKGG